MSRVGVWSRIDKLRKAGLVIEASQNLGYRLVAEPNSFNLPLLNAWMKENRGYARFLLTTKLIAQITR